MRENLKLTDFSIGLYEQALKLLEPGSNNFSILSGCILLTVGLEKFIKSILHSKNPLMILYKKIEFEHLLLFEQGSSFENYDTISFEVALERLVKIYPSISNESQDINYIIKQRNFLMHNFGCIDIGILERKVQTKVADISELICLECLEKSPEEIFGEKIWNKMSTNRSAYKQAEILEVEKRIKFLKRLYTQGEDLPCERIEIPETMSTQLIVCPVCEQNTAEVGLDWDVQVDHREGTVDYVHPYLDLIKCQCGFTMEDPEEIELLLNPRYNEIIDSILSLHSK